ncbi:MAG TPA: hypothetical protein VG014_05550 [Acidimicrobiales bacterium]|jgi:hypothetical protein|nr:hypothetical protein [Acidimicrobiales bacterium]
MRYVISGYTVVLAILFLYGAQLVWRRRRLNRLVADVEASRAPDRPETGTG